MKTRPEIINSFLACLSVTLILISTIPFVVSYDFSVRRKVTGAQNLFVITVQFSDKSASIDTSEIKNRVFQEMNDYYRNVSYGKITVTGIASETWVNLSQNMSYYGDYDNRNDHSAGARALIVDTIETIDAYTDFSGFDFILVVHAGEDEAFSGNKADIWSHGYWEGLYATTADGVTFNQGAVVSENDTLGTFCHEFGHVIGLPDLYNADKNSSDVFVGDWGLMGYGGNNGDPMGSKPSHILSWGKIFLEWINNSQIVEATPNQSAIVTIESLEKLSAGVKAIKIPVEDKSYYLVEVRTDEYLPDQGVLLTFVNETKDSGEGIVQVMDSDVSTLSLDDATFHVQEIFEETRHHFTVKVVKQFENSSFAVQISNKLVPHINIMLSRKVEAYQDQQITIRVTDYNGTPLQGLTTTLYINEEESQTSMTDSNGTSIYVVNFDLFMIGKNSIEVHVSGGDRYIDNQIVQTLEITLPLWLFLLVAAAVLLVLGAILFRVRAHLRKERERRNVAWSYLRAHKGAHVARPSLNRDLNGHVGWNKKVEQEKILEHTLWTQICLTRAHAGILPSRSNMYGRTCAATHQKRPRSFFFLIN